MSSSQNQIKAYFIGKPDRESVEKIIKEAVDGANGQAIEIMVSVIGEYRTEAMNAMFHAELRRIGNHFGYSELEMKRVFKDMFLPKRPVKKNGEVVMRPISTASLSISEFAYFLWQISLVCLRHGLPTSFPQYVFDMAHNAELGYQNAGKEAVR